MTINRMNSNQPVDCLIIGGGPAGATAATVLADHGRSVLILEKGAFPRYHIGESLVPHSYHTLKRIGMLDKLKASDFPRKESVQFVSASGRDSQPFYFRERDPAEHSVTWQVTRDRFDRMMLDNAKEHGAKVHEGAMVREVLFDADRAAGVRAMIDGVETMIPARVVIDATGQDSLLSRQLDIRQMDPDLKNATIYGYFQGARRDRGRDAGATIIMHTEDRKGWFWFIPLAEDITSVGVVASPTQLFTGRGNKPQETLDQEILSCPGMRKRLADASQVGDVYVTRDFSYRSKRISGPGWVLIGDAFAFLDPVYSSGIMLAMKSGEWAADSIHEALEAGDLSAERLGAFAGRYLGGIAPIRQLIYAFYDKNFSFGKFHAEYPQYIDHVTRILVGDVFDNDVSEMFSALQEWVDLPEPLQLEGSSSAS